MQANSIRYIGESAQEGLSELGGGSVCLTNPYTCVYFVWPLLKKH